MPNVARLFGLSPEQAQYFSDNPTEALTVMEGLMGQAKGKTFEVGDNLVRENPDGTVEVVYQGEQKGDKPPVSVAEFEMAQRNPEFMDFLVKRAQAGRAPAAPRAPDAYERKVTALRLAGVPENEIPAIAAGVADSPLKPRGKGAASTAVDNAEIDLVMDEIDRVLGGEDWQSGSGVGNLLKGGANVVANALYGEEAFPSMTRKGADVAKLEQLVTAALATNKKVTEGDFKRVKALLPGLGVADSADKARTRLVEIRKLFDDIRNRPLPSGAASEPSAPSSGDDPLGLFNAD
jgi:hypothetical protein